MKTQKNEIMFDGPKLERLRIAYRDAVKAKADTFLFEGQELVTQYAYYLIEFLEHRFGREKKRKDSNENR